MKSIIKTKRSKYPLYLWLVGLAAGVVNGFLGAGGGIVLVFALAAFYKSKDDSRVKDIFAVTVASVLPISAISVMSYGFKVNADFSGSARFIVPALLGGAAGALLTDKIKISALKLLFAAVTIIAGINMMLK